MLSLGEASNAMRIYQKVLGVWQEIKWEKDREGLCGKEP